MLPDPAAVLHCLQKAHHINSLAGWAAAPMSPQRQPGSTQHNGMLGQDHDLHGSSSSSNCSSSDSSTDEEQQDHSTDVSRPTSRSSSRHMRQEHLTANEAPAEPIRMRLEPQSRHRKHLGMMKAAAVTAAEEAEEAGIQQKAGYTGGAAAAGMANLRR